jgi:hypothetical protein
LIFELITAVVYILFVINPNPPCFKTITKLMAMERKEPLLPTPPPAQHCGGGGGEEVGCLKSTLKNYIFIENT